MVYEIHARIALEKVKILQDPTTISLLNFKEYAWCMVFRIIGSTSLTQYIGTNSSINVKPEGRYSGDILKLSCTCKSNCPTVFLLAMTGHSISVVSCPLLFQATCSMSELRCACTRPSNARSVFVSIQYI